MYNLSHTIKFSILPVSEESPSSLPSQSSGSEGQQHRLSTGSDDHYEPYSESGSHEFEEEGEETPQSEETTGRENSGEGDGSAGVSETDTVRDGSEEREGSQKDAGNSSSGSEEDVIVQQV